MSRRDPTTSSSSASTSSRSVSSPWIKSASSTWIQSAPPRRWWARCRTTSGRRRRWPCCPAARPSTLAATPLVPADLTADQRGAGRIYNGAVDIGAYETHTYSLVSGAGDADNASFSIDAGGNLRTAAGFDFEAKSSYSVRVRSTDAGGLSTEKVFTISVSNVNEAPTANAGGPYTVAEGGIVVLRGTGRDADAGDALRYAWDLDKNGTFETTGPNPTFSAGGLDGPGSRTVRLRVTDAQGLFSDSTATIKLTNVAPRVTIHGPTTWDPRRPYVLSLRSSDPGRDAIRFWTISWGDGTVQRVRGNPTRVSHRYPLRTYRYVIRAIATDEDGSYRTNMIAVRQVIR
jgi:hypothetical protein